MTGETIKKCQSGQNFLIWAIVQLNVIVALSWWFYWFVYYGFQMLA